MAKAKAEAGAEIRNSWLSRQTSLHPDLEFQILLLICII